MSYVNLVIYCATLPDYTPKEHKSGEMGKARRVGRKRGGSENEKIIRADDPKNRDLVKAVIGGYKFD